MQGMCKPTHTAMVTRLKSGRYCNNRTRASPATPLPSKFTSVRSDCTPATRSPD